MLIIAVLPILRIVGGPVTLIIRDKCLKCLYFSLEFVETFRIKQHIDPHVLAKNFHIDVV